MKLLIQKDLIVSISTFSNIPYYLDQEGLDCD